MSKVMNLIRRAPRRASAVIAMFAAAIVVPAALFAWGPDRPTFTVENAAPYVTFNSITNNQRVGDERNFVRIKEDAAGTTYGDAVNFQPGKVYEVMVYYHNNAKTELNASGKGIAQNTMLKMEVPGVVKPGVKAALTGKISASNANPGTVWDEAYGTNATGGDIALRYVSGSATVTSNGAVNGQKLPDSVFTTGAHLGYDSLNGVLPGCNEFAGYVTFKFRVDQPNFEISKQVHKTGVTGWKESETVKPGDKVDYLITYKNTGTAQQNDVVIKDALPQGMTYVPGTTFVANTTNPNGIKVSDNIVTASGINIGNYAAGAAAYVKFTAQVNANDQLPTCGTNTLRNTASAVTQNGGKSDTADVVVPKECAPEPKYTCDALSVQRLSRTQFKFSTSYTVENATFKSVTYVVRNAAGAEVSRSTNDTYTQQTAGKYTVEAIVTVTVNGQDKTVTGPNCKKEFEVVPPEVKTIEVCELATKKVITIKETEFDASKHSRNLEDCKEVVKKIEVCELATKTIIRINENEFDASKHSRNLEDCKEVVKKIDVCELASKTIIRINEADFDASKHSKNLEDCKSVPPVTPPTTPSELPMTGAGENILGAISLGALVASITYYAASRRLLGAN